MGGGDLSRLSGLYPLTMSIAMLAVLALAWGGVVVLRRGDRLRGVLMLVCALVILGNVLVWATWPRQAPQPSRAPHPATVSESTGSGKPR